MSNHDMATTRIAVIGIGSAGLGQLKQTRDAFERSEVRRRTKLELVGIETRSEVGGLWWVHIAPVISDDANLTDQELCL